MVQVRPPLIVLLVSALASACIIEPNPSPFGGDDPFGKPDDPAEQFSDAASAGPADTSLPSAPDVSEPPPPDDVAVSEDSGPADPDVVEPPPYLDPATAPFVLDPCPSDFTDQVLPWAERPSSEKDCFPGACLPWERCHGANSCPFPESPEEKVGSLKCYRPCGECPAGGECKDLTLQDCDVVLPFPACLGADSPQTWPQYTGTGPHPSEGGLGCWTKVIEVPGKNSGMHVTRVGDWIYWLHWDMTTDSKGALVAMRRLQVLPFATPGAPALTLLEETDDTGAWTRMRSSGGRLLILRSPVPETPGLPDGVVANELLWGEPGEDGALTLESSGLTVELDKDQGATVPGTEHGCLLGRTDTDLRLTCFPVTGGSVAIKHSLLGAPGELIAALDQYESSVGHSPLGTRSWSAAASSDWFAVITGAECGDEPKRQLHYAPYDPNTDATVGLWTMVDITGVLPPCTSSRRLIVYRDTLLYQGMSTRLGAGAVTPWLATTLPSNEQGTPIGWDLAGDVLLSANLMKLTGKDPPAALYGNRILW